MGYTIGSQQGSYDEPDSVNRTEENDGGAENDQQGVNPADMTGTLETSDPDNTQDSDDVSAAVDAGLVPEGQGPDIPDANQQIVVVDGEPQTVPLDEVATVVEQAGGNPAVAQGDANATGTTDTTGETPSTGTASTDGEGDQTEAKDPNGTMAEGDDPSDFNVGPVNKYLSSLSPSDAEYKRVIKAEKKGKSRQSILDA